MHFGEQYAYTQDNFRIVEKELQSLQNEVTLTITVLVKALQKLGNNAEAERIILFFYDSTPERDSWEPIPKHFHIVRYDGRILNIPYILITKRTHDNFVELVKENYEK